MPAVEAFLESVGRAPISLPTAEPVSLEEAKHHLRIDLSDDDVMIAAQLRSARAYVERVTGQALVRQAWDESFEGFPGSDWVGFQLGRAPIRSVTSITYHDEDLSTSTVYAASKYQADTSKSPAVVVLKPGQSWPTDSLRDSSGVVIRYVAGYEVPFTANESTDVITAVGHWFSDGDVVRVRASGDDDAALPAGLSADTDYYVISVSGDTLSLSTTSGGNAVDITDTGTGTFFVGAEPSPPDLRAYILLLLTSLYEHRSTEVTGTITTEMKFAAGLLDGHRMHWF